MENVGEREKRNFVFVFHSNFNVTCIYPLLWTVKKKKRGKKKWKKKNNRNKKKNIVHTSPIGKNDAPRFILFRYVDSRITL